MGAEMCIRDSLRVVEDLEFFTTIIAILFAKSVETMRTRGYYSLYP